jgi:hypothetical protein
MTTPIVHFGDPGGSIAKKMLRYKGDIGSCRPWMDRKTGRSYITLNEREKDGGYVWNSHTKTWATRNVPLHNTEATLFHDQWKIFDKAIFRAFRQPMILWANLRKGNIYRIPNAMRSTVLQYQSITDAGNAVISMDGLRRGQRDRPHTDIKSFPLPLIHGDFSFTLREIEASRDGEPLDTYMIEQTSHQCGNLVEGLTAGTEATYTYSGASIYGYGNHPNRTDYTMVDPTGAGWTPDDTVDDVIAMRQVLINDLYVGPWRLYVSPSWDTYLDKDYSAAKGDNTLRERIMKIAGISSIETAWKLTSYKMLLVKEGDSRVGRAIVGFDPRVIEWEAEGGMDFQFKILLMNLPQLRANTDDNCGWVNGII